MSVIEKLLAYQEEDKKLFAIEKQLKECEARKTGIKARKFLSTVGETLAGIEGKASELCGTYNSLFVELEKLKEDNAEFSAIADSVDDEKEIGYLKNKAEELGKKLDELAKKIARIEGEMNEVARQYSKLGKETLAYQEQLKTSGAEYEKFKAPFEPEIKKIETELRSLAKGIPQEYMLKYAEKRKDKRFPIVYQLGEKDSHCGGCGTELSMKQIDSLKKDDTIIECENCRALLFKKR